MRVSVALYHCACYGHSWTPSFRGYLAFWLQIMSGLRHWDGRMYWMGE
mgnify:CR=1 FL=1